MFLMLNPMTYPLTKIHPKQRDLFPERQLTMVRQKMMTMKRTKILLIIGKKLDKSSKL